MTRFLQIDDLGCHTASSCKHLKQNTNTPSYCLNCNNSRHKKRECYWNLLGHTTEIVKLSLLFYLNQIKENRKPINTRQYKAKSFLSLNLILNKYEIPNHCTFENFVFSYIFDFVVLSKSACKHIENCTSFNILLKNPRNWYTTKHYEFMVF